MGVVPESTGDVSWRSTVSLGHACEGEGGLTNTQDLCKKEKENITGQT